jgi:hypothetical protein
MTAAEFARWQQFDRQEPIGDQENHHYPIAYLQSTVRNMMSSEPVSLQDCLLYVEREEKSIESQLSRL